MGAEESHFSQLETETICEQNVTLKSKTATKFPRNSLSLIVNEQEHTVDLSGHDPDIKPTYLLVDYLRDKLGLTGTKYMCRMGGCGSCIVTLKTVDPATGKEVIGSVNSCLLPLYACDGLDITTVEALGNQRDGYNKIQDTLVKFGGTQCGFCTPGVIMTMHSLTLVNPKFESKDVEYSFDGNICRCTGYRPIMDAFKSLAVDPSEELKRKCIEIEDLYKCPLKTKLKRANKSNENMEVVHIPRSLHLQGPQGEHWFKVTTLNNLYDTIQQFVSARVKYRIVAGYTGTGIFKNDGPYEGYIEINDIPELKQVSIDQTGLTLGGNVTLTAAIDIFNKLFTVDGFPYAKEIFQHFRIIACLSVRNRGSLAGNLMLKHMHREFHSDVFVLLEALGARLTIGSSLSLYQNMSLMEFLKVDMTGRIILSIHFPRYGQDYVYKRYKVSKRYQQSSAYVNAAFLFHFDEKNLTIRGRPRICFGGINPNFVRAYQTEEYLEGKQLNNEILQKALKYLEYEVAPDARPGEASPAYRLGLAQSFLYKALLHLMENHIDPRLRSGANIIHREINKGYQVFDTDQSKWPLNQPVPKIESYQQTSGEAQFINDIRPALNELHGVFVVTSVGNASIKSIDASQALDIPGVVAFFTAKDIPGVNNFAVTLLNPEEVFAVRFSSYAGKPVGLLVAQSRSIALEARDKVKIEYDDFAPVVVDVAQAVKNLPNDSNTISHLENLNLSFPCKGINKSLAMNIIKNMSKPRALDEKELDKAKTDSLYKVKGEFQTGGQYHFHMETQICICVPREDGMDIWSSTQWMEHTQSAVASVLNVPHNSLNMVVKRIGGGFGAKASRPALVASACAVAAHLTRHPVRVELDLETNMQMIGKRLPYFSKYEVQFDETGKIHQLNSKLYCDAGAIKNEPTSLFAMICSQSCYQANDWHVTPSEVVTNTAPNTYTRAPGSAVGVALIETIMEHIARLLKIDPLKVREANFIRKGDPLIAVPDAKLVLDNPLRRIIADLKASCNYDSRKAYLDEFNMNNRWMKRGISIIPQRYPIAYHDLRLPTFISVYSVDGTVNISHGGIEMGQGVNTKVAQVVAHTLQIPLEKVKVHPSYNVISPNTSVSAGSVTSELICSSARRACLQLLEKLEPVRKELDNPTWEQLIAAANAKEILLTSQFQEKNGDVVSYDVWGVTCTEVEVDVLTGDFKIVRTDIIEDAGQSISPLIDIGQVEGAYVMGLGWWLTEELIYDDSTGALITDDIWTYKPMLPADVPEDFRVTLLKNAPNPFGVLSSKATGEPPLNMSVSVIFALRHAIDSARNDAGNTSWYQMDGPVTREKVRQLSLTNTKHFVFNKD